MHEVQIWVLVDENGEYAVAAAEEDLESAYEDAVSAGSGLSRRVVKVTLKVPVVSVVELSGTVPNEGAGELKVS